MRSVSYNLSLYPGQKQGIQLRNTDGTVYTIPTGAVASSKVVTVCTGLVCDMGAEILSAAQGTIAITLPDTAIVRAHAHRLLIWDFRLALPSGLAKRLPTSVMTIEYSPSAWQNAPIPTVNTNVGTGGVGGGSGGSSVAPTILYVQDQIWVSQSGERVQVTIERQPNGDERFKLTEVL